MGWHKIKSPHKLFIYKDLINLQVIPSGFEPETLCLEGRRRSSYSKIYSSILDQQRISLNQAITFYNR